MMSKIRGTIPADGILRAGDIIAGVRVVHLLNLSARLYQVRHECCGHRAELTVAQIQSRVTHRRTHCSACGHSAGAKITNQARYGEVTG